MPYIKQGTRTYFTEGIERLTPMIKTEGELNYVITCLVKAFADAEPGYSVLASVTGVLENVKQEFYRRVAVPYEDKKIKENGDVY